MSNGRLTKYDMDSNYAESIENTKENIENALGFTPASHKDVSELVVNVKSPPTPYNAVKGDGTDLDVDYMNAIIRDFKKVFFPEGTYIFPSGKELIPNNNTEIYGIRGKTIFKKETWSDRDAILNILSPYTTPSDSISKIHIHDITFLGNVDVSGFSEYNHLIAVRGVDGLEVNNCDFLGFRGDGVCLGVEDGQHPDGIEHRRNSNVVIRDNFFDGINKDNRNAISVISGHNVKIHSNTIKRTTKSTMPGAIDIEPNPYPVYTVENIEVFNNNIDDIGGNTGAICVFCPSPTKPKNIKIYNNVIKNTFRHFYIRVYDDTYNSNIQIYDNICENSSSYGIYMGGNLRGFKLSRNTVSSNDSTILLGASASSGLHLTDGSIVENSLTNLSTQIAIRTHVLNNVDVERNNIFTKSTSVAVQFGIDESSSTYKTSIVKNDITCENSPIVVRYFGSVDTENNKFENNTSNRKYGPSGIPAINSNSTMHSLNIVTGDSPLDVFPNGISSCLLNNSVNTPGGIGLLTTVRVDVRAETAYNNSSHQIYRRKDLKSVYIRFWDVGTSSWLSWDKFLTQSNPDKGTTAQRPTSPVSGQVYYDTSLKKPVWWNGTSWTDSAGAVV